jgi:hypothetical protein
MFFREWRAKRRAQVAQQWMFEQMSLPPVEVPTREIDQAELERWRREQAALRPASGPTVVLDCDTDDIEQKVESLLDWQAQTAPWLKTILESHRDTIHFLEAQRICTVQQLHVMSSVLDSLIVTHVRPDALLLKWHHEVPELIDHIGDKVPDDLGEHLKEATLAWKDLVKHYTKLIERADAYYKQQGEQDD